MNDSLSLDYLLSFVTLPNVLGATGALFYVISMSMKTVIPLRVTSLVSASCLLGSSILARSLPAILLYALLLPVHAFRLYQMLELIKKVRAAAGTDLSMNWLRPYMKKRKYRKGDMLFRKRRGFFFCRAANFTNHYYAVGFSVLLKEAERIDVGRADDRIPADPDR